MRDLLAATTGVQEHRLFLRPLVDFLERQHAQAWRATNDEATWASQPATLQATGLGFRYPETPRDVLSDLTFAIAPGERVAVIGANGSGKSNVIDAMLFVFGKKASKLRLNNVRRLSVPRIVPA